ncbi:RHS repeat-associated core domain-containing protein [Massilia sp. W12]|uniref:RHS repeat domain-containing protein n=1 Tax=Massilia sp. W12 TaxID=3126507 RepID=UPI0030CAEE80
MQREYAGRRYQAHYVYDAFQRRIAKYVQSARYDEAGVLQDKAGELHYFVWDGDVLQQEIRFTQHLPGFPAPNPRPRPASTGWDGAASAHAAYALDEGLGECSTYIYEADSFVPMARVVSQHEQEEFASPSVYLQPVPAWRSARAQVEDPSPQDGHCQAQEEWRCRQMQMQRETRAAREAGKDRQLYYHCDHIGAPLELLDSDGDALWSARRLTWGKLHETQDKHANQPLRFQGQYYDAESGLHYNRYRYYDPEVGRFVSQDPIGLLGGENFYLFAPNAISWSDPLGLKPCINRREALNKAKELAGIPRSQQPRSQWVVGDDVTRQGMKNYKYTKNPTHFGRFYEFVDARGHVKVVVEQ